jgi:ubiquinone/menaquinone biosynthesis C-methylase UbiE
MSNDTGAFDALANGYARWRPSYPIRLFEELARTLPDRGMALDVGAGTGISTRQLADALGSSWTVIGAEPGEGMLTVADAQGRATIRFVKGTAEALPSGDGTVQLVLAAQAVQWFDRPRFYREVQRVLSDPGWIAVVQNNRLWRESTLLAAYEELLERYNPTYRRDYRAFDVSAELAAAGFVEPRKLSERWTRPMSREDFAGFVRTSTKFDGVVARVGRAAAGQLVEDLLERHWREPIDVLYETELFIALRHTRLARQE